MTPALDFAIRPAPASRIAALRADIAGARQKLVRLESSIKIREQTLNRLLAQRALNGDLGAARFSNE